MLASMPAADPASVTLAVGNEDLLVDRVVAAVLAAVRRIDPSAERRDVDAAAADAAAQLNLAASPSLFGEAAVIVVDSIDSAEDLVVDELVRAASGADGMWFVAIHPGGVKGKKILERLRKAGAAEVACAAPKRGRATQEWLADEFQGMKRKVTPRALDVIQEAVGLDLRELASACSQLVADIEHDPIDEADVREYFGGIAEVSGFQIADAVLGRQAVEALLALRWAAAGDERRVGPVTIAAVASGLRSLVRYSGAARGGSDLEVAKEAGVPVWKVRILREQLRRWHPEQLARAVAVLADADAAAKGGLREGEQLDAAQKHLALERALLTIARGVPVED
jgi:DNA polymerase III delta subunit